MSEDTFIWPVGDLSCDDDDETQGEDGALFDDCVSIGSSAMSVGHAISIGHSVSAYSGSYTSKQYVEQQINGDGDPTVKINGDLVVSDVDGSNEMNVTDFMKTMKDRMLILQPSLEALEEYPALKDAYDQYKMLEKLLMDNNAKKD